MQCVLVYMNDYFHGPFKRDLTLLHTTTPSNVVREHMLGSDASAVFFGGSEWKRAAEDLAGVDPAARPHFILSLFMVIVTEQCLHAHFPPAQPAWRARTGFPLFGWSGFGPHFENPYHILRAPVTAGLVDEAAAVALAPAFAAFFRAEVAAYFAACGLGVRADEFFAALRADATYAHATRGLVRGQNPLHGVSSEGREADKTASALVRAVALALGPGEERGAALAGAAAHAGCAAAAPGAGTPGA